MATVLNEVVVEIRAAQHPDAPLMLVSNPNAGKTTLFNQLTGLRHKTSNYPGTTLDLRSGTITLDGHTRLLYDMPGLYTLEGGLAEERIAIEAITAGDADTLRPGAIIQVVDSTNLVRNLFLAGQVLELGVPTVIALNMVDLAEKQGIEIDIESLEAHLGCPVVPIVARKGTGIESLLDACLSALKSRHVPPPPRLLDGLSNIDDEARYRWAETVGESCIIHPGQAISKKTEAVDAVLTHPVAGMVAFFGVLFAVFYMIFSIATLPMALIDRFFGEVGGWVGAAIPEGQLQSLIVNGVIAGVGGVLVFLPQICILFFCLSILEDTGYLSRAACVVDRWLRRVGLPGKAFVPMLSAHACAIPAIMSARIIEDRNDRLITILVLPLMTCSARLPVYLMMTALLFPASPLKGALVFTGAYALGLFTAMAMAFIFRRALVKKPPSPLMIELPSYKMPSLKTALLAAYDRSFIFMRKAGTVILAISIILWWLMSYPRLDGSATASAATDDASGAIVTQTPVDAANEAQLALSHSYAGRTGRLVEPVLEPLGFDWKIGVAIVASFAAREVVVSALSVIYGVGDEGTEDKSLLLDKLRTAKRADGTPVFTFATSASLLVFYVLAMQCLPTQAITHRETGSWKWAGLQVAYMTCLAYAASFIAYNAITFFGGA